MEQRYIVRKSERIFSASSEEQISVFTSLVNEKGNEYYPFRYPAKYMIPGESQGYGFSDINENIDLVRFLTVCILDENGNLLILDKDIPHDEFWCCSFEFAKRNNWI